MRAILVGGSVRPILVGGSVRAILVGGAQEFLTITFLCPLP